MRPLAFVFALAAFVPPAVAAAPPTEVRSGRIEWTRLVTPSRYWNRHSDADGRLLNYLAKHTSLTVEPKWKATSAKNLDELCTYPFVYAHDVSPLTSNEAKNLAEYLRRGGFLFVDFCANDNINPPPSVFMDAQIATLRPHLPELKVARVTPDHEVFSVYFRMRHFPPQTRPGDSRWVDGPTNPMYALLLGERIVAFVGLSAFQCAWSGVGDQTNAVECMEMLANIYVYAMTH